jgi:RNA polymerase sigma factor (sigma-70 family)
MARPPADAVHDCVPDAGRPAADRLLLERFLTHRDEAAFAALVQRHSRTVWGVCRRVLNQEQEAEDAFQAVFLVLARKAASIRKTESVGSWLYGVAYRTALKARRGAQRRHRVERQAASCPQQQPTPEATCRELQRLLDEELQRLPEKYRAPFVLCCLEGLSKAEAAVELGWKHGTVSGRLAQARKLLQQSLARRGVTLTAVLTTFALTGQSASAAAPAALVQATAQAVLPGNAAGLSPSVLQLASGSWTATGIKAAAAVLLAAAALVAAPPAFKPEPAKRPAEPQVVQTDDRILAVAFSPDGRRLVTGGAFKRPGHLQIWDVAGARLLVTLRGFPGVRSAAFSPDGEVLATGHFEGEIKLRDPLTGRERATLAGHEMGANWLAFSPDGGLLASAGLDQSLRVWDMKTLREREEYLGHKGMVLGVAFFRHGRALVSGGEDRTARIWDRETGKERLVLRGHSKPVETVAVSPDDKVVLTGSWDRTIRLWDAQTGEPITTLRQKGGSVQALAFSPDGATLASAGGDGTIHLWDAKRWALLRSVPRHEGKAWGVAFSPDGKLLVSCGEDKSARLWDPVAGRDVATLSAPDAEATPEAAEGEEPEVRRGIWLAAGIVVGVLLALGLALWHCLPRLRSIGAQAVAVSLVCPGCQRRLKVSADRAGGKVRCPGCGQAVTVPAGKAP